MNPIYGNPPMELRKSTVDTGMPSVPRAEKGRKEGDFFDKEKEEFSWFTMMTVPKFGIYHDFCGKKTWILYGFVKYSQIFIWDLPYDLHWLRSSHEMKSMDLASIVNGTWGFWPANILKANQPTSQGIRVKSVFFSFCDVEALELGEEKYMCPFGEDRKKCTWTSELVATHSGWFVQKLTPAGTMECFSLFCRGSHHVFSYWIYCFCSTSWLFKEPRAWGIDYVYIIMFNSPPCLSIILGLLCVNMYTHTPSALPNLQTANLPMSCTYIDSYRARPYCSCTMLYLWKLFIIYHSLPRKFWALNRLNMTPLKISVLEDHPGRIGGSHLGTCQGELEERTDDGGHDRDSPEMIPWKWEII